MPDVFTNAKPYFDIQFPSSGDGFSIAKMRNQFLGLGMMDFIPGKPVATGRNKIAVMGRDASGFFNPVYYGDNNQRTFFQSGDSPVFVTPSSGKVRLDIVYLNTSGDILIQQGTEVVSNPTLPSLGAVGGSGDTRLPICAVLNKSTQSVIWSFEDKDSHTGDGYIQHDLRPWLRFK